MSAADSIHPMQLSMLMPAHEVAKMDYGDAYKQTPDSRAHTLNEKRYRNEVTSMEPHMDEPVTLWHGGSKPSLWDGHHRLTHALDTNPNRELLVSHDSHEAGVIRWIGEAAARRKGKRR